MSCTAMSGRMWSGATDDGGRHSGDAERVPRPCGGGEWTGSVPQAAEIVQLTEVAPAGVSVGMGIHACAYAAGTPSTR
jgi:hypothetical protein